MWDSTPNFGISTRTFDEFQRVVLHDLSVLRRDVGVAPSQCGGCRGCKMDDKTPCASDNEEEQFDDDDDEGVGVSSKQLDFECARGLCRTVAMRSFKASSALQSVLDVMANIFLHPP